jgi:Fur family zinc uptake transcriptional regulator
LRAGVLDLVRNAERPIKAYELLRALAEDRGHVAPPTVYRALNYLTAAGLVHRIESLNAFAPCRCAGALQDNPVAHVFFICNVCGAASEFAAPGAGLALRSVGDRIGFAYEVLTLEVQGVCSRCSGNPAGVHSDCERQARL